MNAVVGKQNIIIARCAYFAL